MSENFSCVAWFDKSFRIMKVRKTMKKQKLVYEFGQNRNNNQQEIDKWIDWDIIRDEDLIKSILI